MTSDKKHAPDSLKYQWKLLGEVHRSDWATSLDKSIAYEIIDNYYSRFGNSRTSLRYLEKATGAARQNVIVSLRRLCENGPFSVARKGSGVRPTEYNLHFDKVAENASGHAGVTASNDFPSGHADITTGGHADDTSKGASGHAGVTESVLLVPAYKADVLDRMIDTAAPAAPPLAGLTPATAETAVEERANSQDEDIQVEDTRADGKPTFEALWRAYAHAKGKAEARKAWAALPADTNLAAVIDAAAAWQASWAAQGKPDAPRFTLARWLKDERYDEDAPTGYQPKAKVPQNSAKRAAAKPTKRQPAAPITARVTASEVVQLEDGSQLRFVATDESGVAHEHVITLEHPNAETQFEGQRQLAKLVHAAGLEQIEDSSELHGRTIVIAGDGFTAPTTRPDDEPPLPVKPVVAPPAPPPSEPLTEAEVAEFKARIDAFPPIAPFANEWQRKKEAQWRREARLREWDAAYPELFEHNPEPQSDDWPEWLGAEFEEDDSQRHEVSFETWRKHAGLSEEEGAAVLGDDEAA